MFNIIVMIALLPAALAAIGWLLTLVFWSVMGGLGACVYLISLPFRAISAIKLAVFGRPVR